MTSPQTSMGNEGGATSAAPAMGSGRAKVLNAYGGAARWRALETISLRVSAGGLAFRMKWQAPDVKRKVVVHVAKPYVRFPPEGSNGLVEVFAGNETRLEREDGTVVGSRANPARYFPGGRRALWWDRLDQVYFKGYALWNYLTFPALLLRPEIDWQEPRPGTLRAIFPPGFPTHNDVQEFHYDLDTGLLRQHDYTANAFGGWAKAAHRVLEHETFDGIPFGTRRRVTPRKRDGSVQRFPVLIHIRFEDIQVSE